MHYCKKYWLIAGCFFFFSPLLKGQDTLTSANIETQSYNLYLQKNWDELIRYGNLALQKGVDYYYLRYRLGVAYFEKKKYRMAAVEFEKAIAFNSSDEALEYLYYCYLDAGEYERARWLTKSFSPDAISYTGSNKLKPVSFANLEGGIGKSDSSKQFQNETFFQAGLGAYINKRFSLFQAVTYFEQDAFRGNIKQLQYYAGANVPLKNGWTFNAGAQPIITQSEPEYFVKDSVIAGPPPRRGLPPPRKAVIVDSAGSTNSKFNFVFAASLAKSFSYADVLLGAAIGKFDTATQYEGYLGITFYPMANNLFSVGGIGYIHTETYFKKLNYTFVPSLNITPLRILTVNVSYLMNTGGNITEDNAYIVSGTPDYIVGRLSCTASVTLSKRFTVFGNYECQDNIEEHRHWAFYYDIFIAGIKYIPQ